MDAGECNTAAHFLPQLNCRSQPKKPAGTVSSSVIVKVTAFDDEIDTLGLLTDAIVIVPVSSPS